MENVVEAYIAKRRNDELAKKQKDIDKIQDDEERSAKLEKLLASLDEKYDFRAWVENAARRAQQLAIVSHPPKFSHPDAKGTTKFIASQKSDADGFVRSGNAEVAEDVYGNAAALDVYGLLMETMPDSRTLLEHLVESTADVRRLFSQLADAVYEDCRNGFLAIVEDSEPSTHDMLKQVYFPVKDAEYHLLSIVTSSGSAFGVRRRISASKFDERAKEAREHRKKGTFDEQGYDDYPNLVEVAFGGANAQNVSLLNKRNGGSLFLFQSVPPTLSLQKRLPKRSFLRFLSAKRFAQDFEHFHRLTSLDWNNLSIRDGRLRAFDRIMDGVFREVWALRMNDAGWSEGRGLSLNERIWLDDAFVAERQESDEWIPAIATELVRWFLAAYRRTFRDAPSLGDATLGVLTARLLQDEEALR